MKTMCASGKYGTHYAKPLADALIAYRIAGSKQEPAAGRCPPRFHGGVDPSAVATLPIGAAFTTEFK